MIPGPQVLWRTPFQLLMVQRNGFQALQIVSLCFCLGEMKGGLAPYMWLWRLCLALFRIFTPFYRINDISSITLWTGGWTDSGGCGWRKGGLLCWIPKWNSVLFLFGITWWGSCLCTQPFHSLSSVSKLSPPKSFYLCSEDCFFIIIILQWTLESGRKDRRRRRTMKCRLTFKQALKLFVLGGFRIYSQFMESWTYTIVTFHWT